MSKPAHYDLIVIGGGSGGVRAARVAAGHGARVALIEEYRLGGTCVIRGCVPKKLLVYAARCADSFIDAQEFGWDFEPPRFDWPRLIRAKDHELTRLEGVYRRTLEDAGVEVHMARGSLLSPQEVELSTTGAVLKGDRILIATGGKPNLDLRLTGIQHVITSNEVFHLERLPDRVIVAGGGYIAMEFASLFLGMGVETTLLYRGEEVLREFDIGIRSALRLALEARGLNVICGQVFTEIRQNGDHLLGRITDGRELPAEQILFAIGRSPETQNLGLDKAGVLLGSRGEIVVDTYSQTNVPSVYAVGDVTNRLNLTPAAIREGHAFADSCFGPTPRGVQHDLVPSAVFTTPEIASVGLTEAQARAQFPVVELYESRFRPMKSTLGTRQERSLLRLLVDGDSQRVVGAHMLGPESAEMIQLLAIPIGMQARKSDFDAALALHPSAAEEWVTMARPSARFER